MLMLNSIPEMEGDGTVNGETQTELQSRKPKYVKTVPFSNTQLAHKKLQKLDMPHRKHSRTLKKS